MKGLIMSDQNVNVNVNTNQVMNVERAPLSKNFDKLL